MNPNDAPQRDRSLVISLTTLSLVLLALFGGFLLGRARTSRGPVLPFAASLAKMRLVSEMQTQLLASADAEKGAVMADTDEQSRAFAAESMRAAAIVEDGRNELVKLIATDVRVDELEAFREFSDCWARYQAIAREVLELAVENSNLKAQRLSFAPAREALVRMRVALDELVAGTGGSAQAVATTKGAYQAMTAALEIHVLESRHIASPSDDEMDAIEAEMRTFDERVADGLRSLATLDVVGGAVAVEAARAAYADFRKVDTEVLALSRRNTNVRSLVMSLGQKRKVAAECQERLHALREASRLDDDKATR